jgi:hypothetical protein
MPNTDALILTLYLHWSFNPLCRCFVWLWYHGIISEETRDKWLDIVVEKCTRIKETK